MPGVFLVAGFVAAFEAGNVLLAVFADLVDAGLVSDLWTAAGLTLLTLGAAFLGDATFFAAALLATPFFGTAAFATGFFATGRFAADFFAIGFLAAGFFASVFFVAGLASAIFFGDDLLAAALLTDLVFPGRALAAVFGLSALRATVFGAALRAAAGLAATCLLATLLAALAGFAATRVAFTGVFLALFTVRPLSAVVFDLAIVTRCSLFAATFFCALAAVEVRVVFDISLHRDWPWRPGVIAHVWFTSKPASGILATLHPQSRPGSVNTLTRLILWLLGLYKRGVSPLLGPRCRFHPSCSDYARIAVTRFGPWRGSLLTGWRLLRCQPLCSGGEDPVPEHFCFPRCRGHDD